MQKNEQKKVLLQEEKPLIFKEQIPDDIIKELTPEIRRQYFLWDEITKREVQLHPEVVLPLFEEMFHRKYEKGIQIELLSTEYAVRRIYQSGEKVIQSIYSDLLIRVGKDCASSQTREKVGKELTEWARNDIAEFLSCSCDHLYGSEPELISKIPGRREK